MLALPCTVTRCDYRGWQAVHLSNGIVELDVIPQLGGRVMQYRLGSHEFFYVNPRHCGRVYPPNENCFEAGWKNYGGSKVWPAPQGWENDTEWPGPPDPVLDGGPFSSRVVESGPESAAVYLESPADEYTGLTFSREVRIFARSSAARITHTVRNSSLRPVRWSIWQVTQQAANQPLRIRTPARSVRKMFGDEDYPGARIDPQTGLWELDYFNRVAKFAVESEKGWLATMKPADGVALIETFPLFPEAQYPDAAPVEVWVNGEGTFTAHGDKIRMEDNRDECDPHVETEILSPLAELDPGKVYTFPITWQAASLSETEISAVNHCGVILRRLTVERSDGRWRVGGAYGLFYVGSLELVSIHRSGKALEIVPLGEVSPLAPCSVSRVISSPQGIARISARLRNTEGQLLGTVDEVSLPS